VKYTAKQSAVENCQAVVLSLGCSPTSTQHFLTVIEVSFVRALHPPLEHGRIFWRVAKPRDSRL
jgi:hypothetical protein